MLLRRLVEVVAEPVTPAAAARPHRRADRRQPRGRGLLGLLQPRRRRCSSCSPPRASPREAVHRTRMRVGEGLVGTIAAQGTVINTADAQSHPNFRLLPGDRRGDLPLVPGRADPARRPGRRRADGAEPGAPGLCRGRDRGDADHRLDAGRDVRLRRADRPSKYADVAADAAAMRRLDGAAAGRGRGDRPGLAARAAGRGHPPARRRARRPSSPGSSGRSASCASRSTRCWPTSDLVGGEQREVLEAYRMFAHDTGWLRRIREAIGTGLSAEAAVRRVQEETRRPHRPCQRPLSARAADRPRRPRRPPAAPSGRQGAAATTRPGCPTTPSWSRATSVPPTCSSTTARKLRGVVLEEGSQDRARHHRRPRHRHPDGRPDRGRHGRARPGRPGGARRRQRPRLSCGRTTRSCRPSRAPCATRAERRRYFEPDPRPAVGDRATASRSPCRSTPPS